MPDPIHWEGDEWETDAKVLLAEAEALIEGAPPEGRLEALQAETVYT